MGRRRVADYLLLAGLIVGVVFLTRYLGGSISGNQVVVIDGDSLRLGGNDVRSFGIDAPEFKQKCQLANGRSYYCGRQARRFLRKIIARRPVTCKRIGVDRYDRDIAVCKAGEAELNIAMIKAGWAVSYRSYSIAYAEAERTARAARLGIWRGPFVEPHDWRAERR